MISEAGGYRSDFLAGDALTKGGSVIAATPGIKDALIAAAGDRRDCALSDKVRLTSGAASAEIALLGAEALSWRVGSHDLLWSGEDKVWNKMAICFFFFFVSAQRIAAGRASCRRSLAAAP